MIYTGFGRPKKYYKADDLRSAAQKYFEQFSQLNLPFSIGKCCSHLGITRDTLSEYYKDPEFSDTISWIRAECESDQEFRLLGKETFTPGIVFSLKNNHSDRWKDKTEVDNSISFPTGINVNFIRPDKKE